MSHLTTQIFITKLRRRDIQTTLQWLQFVVQTLNYQNCVNYFESSFTPLLMDTLNCVILRISM